MTHSHCVHYLVNMTSLEIEATGTSVTCSTALAGRTSADRKHGRYHNRFVIRVPATDLDGDDVAIAVMSDPLSLERYRVNSRGES